MYWMKNSLVILAIYIISICLFQTNLYAGEIYMKYNTKTDYTCNKQAKWIFMDVKLDKVIDGDTQRLTFSILPDINYIANLRIIGVDTPEVHGLSKPLGEISKQFAAKWYKDNPNFYVSIVGYGKYGRPLGTPCTTSADCLNVELLKAKKAVPYCGGKKLSNVSNK